MAGLTHASSLATADQISILIPSEPLGSPSSSAALLQRAHKMTATLLQLIGSGFSTQSTATTLLVVNPSNVHMTCTGRDLQSLPGWRDVHYKGEKNLDRYRERYGYMPRGILGNLVPSILRVAA